MIRILLLEDDMVLAAQLADFLEQWGMEVVHAKDASQAIEHFADIPFDVVVADVFIRSEGELTQNGGVRLISHIRQIRGLRTPIIAISGSFSGANDAVFRTMIQTVGASRLLTKPFDPADLANMITAMAEGRD